MREQDAGVRRKGLGGRLRRAAIVTTLTALGLLGATSSALAADGDPAVNACLVKTATAGCTTSAGLVGPPVGIVESPDGRQVYFSTYASAGADPDRSTATRQRRG